MAIINIISSAVAAALLSITPVAPTSTVTDDDSSSTPMGAVDPDWMQGLYYECNPRPHSEKAYKRGDTSPPTAAVPTIVGPGGVIVVLATTIRNRNPHGIADFGVMTADGRELRRGRLTRPGAALLGGFAPGSRVYIQPRTMGTMAKILTPQQVRACAFDLPPGI
ncbi:MAG: hypothetical protein AAF799_28770 [Myxococcota bacterium]